VQRNQAKRLAYGLLYGMGAQALAAELGVAVGEAVLLADDFRRSHAVLDAWMAVRVQGLGVSVNVATQKSAESIWQYIALSAPVSLSGNSLLNVGCCAQGSRDAVLSALLLHKGCL
jgi:hypothetical protein